MKNVHTALMFFMITSAFCFAVNTHAADDPDLARLFRDAGVEGTMVITSLDGKETFIYNKARSEKRFTPSSTFKIPNTLIALQEGAVRDEREVIKWDGKDKGFDAWNRDQTLETAFPASCVWFYQELAKRVGDGKYVSWLSKLGYGNAKTGPDVTKFWLDGQLKISAGEQIEFLRRLYEERLPFKKEHMRLLKKLMIVGENPRYTVRAKTGWAMRTNPQQGWYVGYVEAGKKVCFFAMNIEIRKKGDEKLRRQLTMEALTAKGIIAKENG